MTAMHVRRAAGWGLAGAAALGGIVAAAVVAPMATVGGAVALMGVAWLVVVKGPGLARLRLPDTWPLALFFFCFVVLSGREEGIQYYEVLAGPYFYGFLAWTAFSLLSSPTHALVEDRSEVALLFFVGWSVLSLVWGGVRGNPPEMLGDTLSVLALLVYFPVREQARRDASGRWLRTAVVLVALYVSLRNLLDYRAIVAAAIATWQQRNARVVTNEVVMLLGCVVALTWQSTTTAWRQRLLAMALFGLFTASLILTQSRAFWVDLALAVVVLFALLRLSDKGRLVGGMTLSVVLVGGAAFALLGSALVTTGLGLLARLSTLGSGVLGDISLMSRIVEARSVLRLVWANPVVGYGLGAVYSFYDVIEDVTLTRSYVHNGYVGLLFKAGLVGTLPHLAMWGFWIVRGVRASLRRPEAQVVATTAMLIALLPSASTAMHVYTSDTAFVFALCGGWLSGTLLRHRDAAPSPGTA